MITWRVDRTLLRGPFASDVHALLLADESNWFVTYGFRTRDQQAALYAKYLEGGPRAAPPGMSAHEKGLAVDVTLVVQGHDDWDYVDEAWVRMLHRVHVHPRLHSLDNIGDADHIEAVHWKEIASRG